MQTISHRGAQQRNVSAAKCAQQQRRAGDVEYRVRARHIVRQNAARVGGGQLKRRDERREVQLGGEWIVNRKGNARLDRGGGQPAEERRGDIVGVPLKRRRDREQLIPAHAELMNGVRRHDAADEQRRR